MNTTTTIVASIVVAQVILAAIYDAMAFYFGWQTISYSLYEFDKAWAQLPRWIIAGLWMHVYYGEAAYAAVRRYFRRMP